MDGKILTREEIPASSAAHDAGFPWIGILAKEQIEIQLRNGADMSPTLRETVIQLLDRVPYLVESVCVVNKIADGSTVYGIDNAKSEDIFMFLVTDTAQAVIGTGGMLQYQEENRPPVETDDMLWSAIVEFINNPKHITIVPTLIGWRLGKDSVAQVNEAVKQIRQFGNTPCLFIFAAKTENASGGLITIASLPPSVQLQAIMCGGVAGHA